MYMDFLFYFTIIHVHRKEKLLLCNILQNTCTCIWTGIYKDRFIVSEFKINLHGNDQCHEHIAIIITIFLQSALKRKQLCTINLYICTPTVCPTSRITCTGTWIWFGHELILNLIILFFMVHVRYVKHVQWNVLFENFYGLSKTRIIVCYRGYPWQLQRFGLFWEGSVEDGAPANSSFLPFSGGLCRQRGVWNRGK